MLNFRPIYTRSHEVPIIYMADAISYLAKSDDSIAERVAMEIEATLDKGLRSVSSKYNPLENTRYMKNIFIVINKVQQLEPLKMHVELEKSTEPQINNEVLLLT